MSYSDELREAIDLQKAGKVAESAEIIRLLMRDSDKLLHRLLWLAKTTDNRDEALACANLAYALAPQDEIAQRAVAATKRKFEENGADLRFDVLRLTGMTEAEARAVNWPFRGLNKPIGELLENGTIATKDLLWVLSSDKAYGPVVIASRTLLLSTVLGNVLDETPRPPRFSRGYRISEFWERANTALQILIIGIVFGGTVVAYIMDRVAYFSVRGQRSPTEMQSWIVLVELAWFAIGIAIYFFVIPRFETRGDVLFLGVRGEQRAIEALLPYLRSPWVIIRNMHWKDRFWGDIDIVLVGPTGIWVIEVKAYSRSARVHGDRWSVKTRFGWRKVSGKTPAFQARRNAVRLKDFLEQKELAPGWVNAVVLWAGDEDETTIELKDPTTPVWTLETLDRDIESLWSGKRNLSDEQVSAIGDALVHELDEISANPPWWVEQGKKKASKER